MTHSMKKGYTISVLGNSFVRYLRHLGADGDIVEEGEEILQAEMAITEAARISYLSPSKGEKKDKGLLRYLFKNKHTSPFEQVNISFNIRMPIFIMRQFVRHRTFRLNEVSARYTELDLGFYIPEVWRIQDTKNKQGSLETDELDNEFASHLLDIHNKECFSLYKRLLGKNTAREMARMVLPLSALTEIIVNIDMSNLIKFFLLRDDNHAQYEIQEIARAMKTITRDKFPWIMEMYDELQANKEKLDAFLKEPNVIALLEDFQK